MLSCIVLCYHHESHDTYVSSRQGWEIFQNNMDKNLPHFWVYGYCKVAINLSKNTNTLLRCDAQAIHSMY